MSCINQETFDFLADLKDNNNREWFALNRKRYENSLQNFVSVIDRLIAHLSVFDNSLIPLEAKDCIFRIYRDVRFARDKNPYKTNMGAYISKGGKKSAYAGYYFHLEPNASFISGGIYMVPSPTLKKIREDIEFYQDDFLGVVESEHFVNAFPSLGNDSLKRVPAGFPVDSPVEKYLKLKHITPSRPLSNEEMLNHNLVEQISSYYQEMLPLLEFFNRAISAED